MAAPSLSKPKTDAPKKPTRADFDRYLETREKRLALAREVASLERIEKAGAAQIQAYVELAGGKSRTVECCGHRATITSAKGSVSWVNEFTKIQGIEAAEKLRQEAPPVDRLNVVKL